MTVVSFVLWVAVIALVAWLIWHVLKVAFKLILIGICVLIAIWLVTSCLRGG